MPATDRHHRLLRALSYVFVVAVLAFAIRSLQDQSDQIARNAVERRYQDCLASNDTRQMVSDLATITLSNPPINYPALSSWADLDPSVKALFIEIIALSPSRLAIPKLQQFVNDHQPARDCEAIRGER